MRYPDQSWIGTATMVIAGVSLFALGTYYVASLHDKTIPLVGMIVFGMGFLGCAGWYFWPTNAKKGLIEWAFEQPGAYGLQS